MMTQSFQTRAQSSFILSPRADAIFARPQLRHVIGVFIVRILRMIGVLQTALYYRAAKVRRECLNGQWSKQGHARKKRPPFNAHSGKRRRRQQDDSRKLTAVFNRGGECNRSTP